MIRKLQDTCFLKFLNSLVFILIILFLFGCNDSNQHLKSNDLENLNLFFKRVKPELNIKNIDFILVLTEVGCPSCNKSFSTLLKKIINKPNALIIVSASGTSIDISAFENDSVKNVLFDDRNEFNKLKLIKNSGALFLKNNKIDTIIAINAEKLNEQLSFIASRIQD